MIACDLADLKIELQITESDDDDLLNRFIVTAGDQCCRATGRTYERVTRTGFIYREPNVFVSDGMLSVKLGVPHITAVSAFAWRIGLPTESWNNVDLSLLDWQDDTGRAQINEYVDAYIQPIYNPFLVGFVNPINPVGQLSYTRRTSMPLWARVSYTAGYSGFVGDDGFPLDLQEIVLWWAAWLYRSKDVPAEKTVNNVTGMVVIPSAMPARLKNALDRWARDTDGPSIG